MSRSRQRTDASRWDRTADDPLGKFIETSALRWFTDSRYRERLTREARPTAAEQMKHNREQRKAA